MKILVTLIFISIVTSCSRFAVDSCVKDRKVDRIYKVDGEKGDALLVTVLDTGRSVPGSFAPGSGHALNRDDADLESIDCPK